MYKDEGPGPFTAIFMQTLKCHSSVTNKDTEMRQRSSESSICAPYKRQAALFIGRRLSPGVGCKPTEPALEKAL